MLELVSVTVFDFRRLLRRVVHRRHGSATCGVDQLPGVKNERRGADAEESGLPSICHRHGRGRSRTQIDQDGCRPIRLQ